VNPHAVLQSLVSDTRAVLCSLRVPLLGPFLAGWPDSADCRAAAPLAGPCDGVLPQLPVLRWIADIASDDQGFGATLLADLGRHARSLAWRQTYTAEEVSDEFLRNYGYTEILGPGVPITARRIACGFLLLGPDTLYPPHRHEAEEVYVPLSGTARWLQGDGIWRQQPPGAVIYHASEEPHATHTGARPLLALYIWHGRLLNQKARLEPAR
jgi:hypothetical protein